MSSEDNFVWFTGLSTLRCLLVRAFLWGVGPCLAGTDKLRRLISLSPSPVSHASLWLLRPATPGQSAFTALRAQPCVPGPCHTVYPRDSWSLGPCTDWLSTALIKVMTKSTLGERGLIRLTCPDHSLSLTEAKAGTEDSRSLWQQPEQRQRKSTAYWLA